MSAASNAVSITRAARGRRACEDHRRVGTRRPQHACSVTPHTDDLRRYERDWTPVHLDIHVDDLAEARERAVKAGAVVEQSFVNPEHGSAVFCCDPFGHGFCLIEHRS